MRPLCNTTQESMQLTSFAFLFPRTSLSDGTSADVRSHRSKASCAPSLASCELKALKLKAKWLQSCKHNENHAAHAFIHTCKDKHAHTHSKFCFPALHCASVVIRYPIRGPRYRSETGNCPLRLWVRTEASRRIRNTQVVLWCLVLASKPFTSNAQ